MAFKRPDAKPQAQYVPPGTKIVDRSSIFQDSDSVEPELETSHLLNDMIQICVKEEESSTQEISETTEVPEEDVFEFKLFSNRPVAKVSIIDKEPTLIVTTRRPSVTQEITPEFQQQVNAASISYDEIMEQSRIPWPAMKMAHHVISIPSKDPNDNKKKRRLTKRQRHRLKAITNGKSMRDPQVPGGWPGWPGERTSQAIITSLYGQLKRYLGKPKKSGNRPPKAVRDKLVGRVQAPKSPTTPLLDQ
ncbi:hypothetical protein INT44_003949 [Umbelopsis vinacea]|uniref:Uncharacterized protein n=1 Tax=Umbelopsis vinacea TaxID=44442 RepID=A0A8H7UMN0_9FUNG|nr:hypothetical protein INT44_003949 [Umbelopsis vinacea]